MDKKNKALLVINLGTPNSTDPQDVGKYLTEFLTDKHVIDIPYLLRQFLVRCLIVPKRKYSAAKNYEKVWTEEGSPLLVYTKRLVNKLQSKLTSTFHVTYAMRYNGPSIHNKIQELSQYDEIIVWPVYPHDTKSSVLTVVEQVNKSARELNLTHKTKIIEPFFEQGYYIESLYQSIKRVFSEKAYPFFLFSYHGIPQDHLPKACDSCTNPCREVVPLSDCYRAQCFKTSDLIAKKLGLEAGSYMTSFQSRLGSKPWIKPYSDKVLEELSEKGVRHIAVVTPSFIVDCLETLEEVAMGLKEDFEEMDSRNKLTALSCLNDDDIFVELFSDYIINQFSPTGDHRTLTQDSTPHTQPHQ